MILVGLHVEGVEQWEITGCKTRRNPAPSSPGYYWIIEGLPRKGTWDEGSDREGGGGRTQTPSVPSPQNTG